MLSVQQVRVEWFHAPFAWLYKLTRKNLHLPHHHCQQRKRKKNFPFKGKFGRKTQVNQLGDWVHTPKCQRQTLKLMKWNYKQKHLDLQWTRDQSYNCPIKNTKTTKNVPLLSVCLSVGQSLENWQKSWRSLNFVNVNKEEVNSKRHLLGN